MRNITFPRRRKAEKALKKKKTVEQAARGRDKKKGPMEGKAEKTGGLRKRNINGSLQSNAAKGPDKGLSNKQSRNKEKSCKERKIITGNIQKGKTRLVADTRGKAPGRGGEELSNMPKE